MRRYGARPPPLGLQPLELRQPLASVAGDARRLGAVDAPAKEPVSELRKIGQRDLVFAVAAVFYGVAIAVRSR